MRESTFAREPLVWIHADQVGNEILSRITDLIPVWAVELELSFHDLSEQVGIRFICFPTGMRGREREEWIE